jgi:hypothetical protein
MSELNRRTLERVKMICSIYATGHDDAGGTFYSLPKHLRDNPDIYISIIENGGSVDEGGYIP